MVCCALHRYPWLSSLAPKEADLEAKLKRVSTCAHVCACRSAFLADKKWKRCHPSSFVFCWPRVLLVRRSVVWIVTERMVVNPKLVGRLVGWLVGWLVHGVSYAYTFF